MKIDKNHAAILLKEYGVRFFPSVGSSIEVRGKHATFERFTQHLPGSFMPLGSYSYSQSYFDHVAKIGRYCSIGQNVTVMGDKHPTEWLSSSPVFYRKRRARMWNSKRVEFPQFDHRGSQVFIDNDVWIGDDVVLSHGIHLGTGCVVATRSVVTKNVPPYTIVGGTPARIIRKRFDDDVIGELLASRWWCWPVSIWDECDPTSISDMLKHLDKVRGTIPELPEDRLSLNNLASNRALLF